MVEKEKEILHINSKNQSLGSSVCQKGDGGVSFRPKKIGISGTLSYFRKGEPSRKGEPIFERGDQKVDAHYGFYSHPALLEHNHFFFGLKCIMLFNTSFSFLCKLKKNIHKTFTRLSPTFWQFSPTWRRPFSDVVTSPS